ncbi:MAG TPA: energy transducer TonB [Vicinamibacterales bacterium]|nr:energy transducer TonB [Vicinamibacterales bacterium]
MVSLTDLRARRVVPAWQEAVAVVQELIHTVVQTQGRDAALPDVDHIALIANGEVVALPGSKPTGHPVRQAARLLQQLLEGAAAPAELEALVNDNIGDTPKLQTLAELTRQLAFFERPGRRSDVEALVSRAMSVDAQNRAEEELRRLKERTVLAADLDAFQSESETAQDEDAKPEPRIVNRQLAAVLALVVAVVLAGAGWWAFSRVRDMLADSEPPVPAVAVETASSPAGADAAAPAEAPAEAVAAQTADAAQATTASDHPSPASTQASSAEQPSLLQRTGASIRRAVHAVFGSLAAAREGTPDAVPAAATSDTAAATSDAANATPDTASAAAQTSRSGPPPRVRRSATAATSSSSPTTAPADAGATAEPPQISTTVSKPPIAGDPRSVSSSVDDVRSVIYSAADADVRPATLLRPVLPAEPPPDVPPDQIGTLELIVDENGDVEHVRLISPSNRFHERMLVAHAKSWKFRPAIRDGRPVKYRAVIRLTI